MLQSIIISTCSYNLLIQIMVEKVYSINLRNNLMKIVNIYLIKIPKTLSLQTTIKIIKLILLVMMYKKKNKTKMFKK